MPQIGVVVPFYNEAATAGLVAEELLRTLRGSGLEFEIVFVADGSTDGTVDALNQVAAREPARIRVLWAPKAEGYGAALLHGLGLLRAEVVGWTDGDGQVPSSTIPQLYAAMQEANAGIGLGLRQRREDGLTRSIASRGYNWLMRRMLGVAVHDINAKPKLVKRSVFESLGVSSRDWFIDTELVVGALAGGARLVRVPVPFLARQHGASKVRFSILREYWRNLRGLRRRVRGPTMRRRTSPKGFAAPAAEGNERAQGAED